MQHGYVALHRKLFKHPLFVRHPEWIAPFCWIFARCAYQNCTVRLASGGYIELKRGQCGITVRECAEALGMAKSNVETMLNAFEDESMMLRARTRTRTRTRFGTRDSHPCTLVTICNYEKYQAPSTPVPAKVGQELGQELGQETPQVIGINGQSVPNHSNHSNQQQKKELGLFGEEEKGGHVQRRPPRHGQVSRKHNTVFIKHGTEEWESHAADFRAAHLLEAMPNRDGGYWFMLTGEANRVWSKRGGSHGRGLSAARSNSQARSATG